MKHFLPALLAALAVLLVMDARAVDARLVDQSYCGAPDRYASGEIKRSDRVIDAYALLHPCPSTGLRVPSCPGWSLNHKTPLACGGCDNVSNMMWMRNDVKVLVDAYERKINALTPPIWDTGACVNVIIK